MVDRVGHPLPAKAREVGGQETRSPEAPKPDKLGYGQGWDRAVTDITALLWKIALFPAAEGSTIQ
jgi:hypothetical protein